MLHIANAGEEPAVIKEGDLVIVYERYDCMKSAIVTRRGRYDNRWGSFVMKVRPPHLHV
jgi:hypothetical protein